MRIPLRHPAGDMGRPDEDDALRRRTGDVSSRAVVAAVLRDALDGAAQGRGCVTWLAGEPGSGKTRLVRDVAEWARQIECNVAWGRCWEGDGAPELWPWAHVMRQCLRSIDDGTLTDLIGPHAAEIADLIAVTTVASDESLAGQFRRFNAIAHFLVAYANTCPLVILLDDLHRADPRSLLLLQFLAQDQTDRPVLIVAAYRWPCLPANDALTRTVVESMREPATRRLELAGLTLEETAAMVGEICGCDAPEGFLTGLHRRTGGNPLFVGECLRQFTTTSAERAGPAWPRAEDLLITPVLSELIAQSLAGLDPLQKGLLGRAARLGADFAEADLCGGSAIVPGALDSVGADLRVAAGLGVLRTGPSPGQWQFQRDMVREYLVRSASEEVPQLRPTAGAPEPILVADAARFCREGEVWTLTFAGRTCRMRDGKGLAHIALLLRHPGQPLHVTEIIHVDSVAERGAAQRVGVEELAAPRRGLGDAGAVLDRKAQREYRGRLSELQVECEDARRCNDAGREQRAQQEMEFLAEELKSAVGLGGRDRRAASNVERARVNVTRSITRAIQRIDEVHPELARHLTQAIRTGTFCTYVAEPATARTWNF